jgi:hypothetical protein
MEELLFLSKRSRVTLHAVHLGPSRDNVQPIGNIHLCCRRTQNKATLRHIFASVHLIEGMAFCRPLCPDLDPASYSFLISNVNIVQFPLIIIPNPNMTRPRSGVESRFLHKRGVTKKPELHRKSSVTRPTLFQPARSGSY